LAVVEVDIMLRNELRRKVEEVETNAAPDTDKQEKLPTRDVAKARERQEWALNNLEMLAIVVASRARSDDVRSSAPSN
jgi:hypothetical protein